MQSDVSSAVHEVIHAPAVSAGILSHDSVSPHRVRHTEACPGGA
jgi:hypothetical protein